MQSRMDARIRLDGIDILRGIAVSGVVMYHFFVLLDLVHNPYFAYIHAFGSLGVPLFFVISGYLIYRSVDNSTKRMGRKRGVINYFLHRFFRIAPAYYVNLFFLLILASLILDSSFLYSSSFLKQLLSNLTFTSYFVHRTSGFGFNGAYWTLNIEMLWYILAPLILFYIQRTRVFLVLGLLSLLYLWSINQGYFDTLFGFEDSSAIYGLELRYLATQLPGQINFFIAGILIYRYSLSVKRLSLKWIYLLSIVIIFLFVAFDGYYGRSKSFVIGQSLTLLVSSTLFVLLYRAKIKGFTFLEWIGKISYSLYLWHMPLLFVMKHNNILHFIPLYITIIVYTLVLLAISSLSYYLIEEGGFLLRKKFELKLKKDTQND